MFSSSVIIHMIIIFPININMNNNEHIDRVVLTDNLVHTHGWYHCFTQHQIENANTSAITDMVRIFEHYNISMELDLRNWDTSNVTRMDCMFGCSELKTLNISGLDLSKVSNMDSMFNTCEQLETLIMLNINTSKVTSMAGMFLDCHSLVTLDLSSFDVSSVEYMNDMFAGCCSLIHIDINNWNTSRVTEFENMFAGCVLLRGPDTTNWDVSNSDDADTIDIRNPV